VLQEKILEKEKHKEYEKDKHETEKG